MAKVVSSKEFVKKLVLCVKEYKKQLSDTRDEGDSAYFFDSNLKKFIKDNIDDITELSTLNFERSFITWIKHYLLKSDDRR